MIKPIRGVRLSRADVDWFVHRMHEAGLAVNVECHMGGWRLYELVVGGMKYVSPRLRTRQFVEYLDAYLAGYERAKLNYESRVDNK